MSQTTKSLPLPRDSTRQSQGLAYGRLRYLTNRIAGLIIAGFLVLHIGGLSVVHVDALSPVLDLMPWLADAHEQTWFQVFYAFLFVAIVFHTLYSFALVAMDLGMRVNYRNMYWIICALSVAAGLAWGVSHA